MAKLKRGDFVFPGHGRGKPLSNMAMEMVLRRMKIENATVHGFCSSFRDWAGNVTNFYKRRKATIDPAQIRKMKSDGRGPSAIAKALKIGRASVYRALPE